MTVTSDRERRLWLWTLAVVVAIYSTLGLARTLAGLVDRAIVDGLFLAGVLLMATAVVLSQLRTAPGWSELGVWLAAAAAYLTLALRLTIPEERTHLIEYGVVALLIHAALTERVAQGHRVPAPALLAVVVAAGLGGLDEAIQAVLPGRVFDPRDLLFNVLAAGLAVGTSRSVAWVAPRVGRDPPRH